MQSVVVEQSQDADELDLELQTLATQLEHEAELHSSTLPGQQALAEEFATASNWEACARNLSSSLAAFGYPDHLNLQSQQPQELAHTCNIINALLVQRQHDVEHHTQFDDHFQRMRSDLNVSEQSRDRLRAQLDAKHREFSSLQNQWRVQENSLQSEVAQLQSDRDDAQKRCADLLRRQAQSQHETRRKDMEVEKLKEQLRNMLMERKREAKRAFDMAGQMSKDASARLHHNAPRKKQEETIKMLVSAYEARQQELLDENQGLQSALADLQSEHCALANQQTTAKQLQAEAVKHLMQDEEEEWTGQLEHLDAAALQAELSNKMDALAGRMNSLEDLDEPLQHELGTALERRLFQDLQTARQVVQEQACTVQHALRALGQQGTAASFVLNRAATDAAPGQVNSRLADAVAAAVEEERTALTLQWQQEQSSIMCQRLQQRQSEMDTVQHQLQAERQQLQSQAEQDRRKLQLQEEAFKHAHACFQKEQAAAREALCCFAPGFGAGHFLANAVARKAAEAAQGAAT